MDRSPSTSAPARSDASDRAGLDPSAARAGAEQVMDEIERTINELRRDDEESAPAVTQRRLDGVVVLRPVGALDDELLADVREQILQVRAPVVVDLDGCTGVDLPVLDELASPWELHRPRMCLVWGSATDLGAIDAGQGRAPLPLFGSVEEALSNLNASGDDWLAPVE